MRTGSWAALALALALAVMRAAPAACDTRAASRPSRPATAERDAAARRRRAGLVRFAREFAAGGIAEASMDAVLFPIDTLKARRQSFHRHCLHTTRPPTMRDLLALGSPVRGIVPAFLSALPAGASFVSTKYCMEMLARSALRTGAHGAGVTMLASACADVVYWALRFPAETGRLRVQALQDRSTLSAVRRLLSEGNYRPAVLYTGWQTVLWRDVPYDALEFGFYEASRSLLARVRRPHAQRRTHGATDEHRAESATCGALSALCAALLTTPLDVARTRLMTQRAGTPGAYTGVIDCVARLLRTDGPAALFAGLGERALMASLGGAIWFSVYDQLRKGPPRPGDADAPAEQPAG